MAVSSTEVIGFGDQLIQLLQDNSVKLKTGGLDVANWIIELTDQKSSAVAEGGKQDEMQAALKKQTEKAQGAHDTLYANSSTKLDAVIGVLGKGSPEAKQAAKLRSTIIKQSKNKKPGKP